jgi:ComF family protein
VENPMPVVTDSLKKSANTFLEFLYPSLCLVCGNRTDEFTKILCKKCWLELSRNKLFALSNGTQPYRVKKYFSFVAWRFLYTDEFRELIHYFKFNEFPVLAHKIGVEMAETVLNRKELKSAEAFVPVPLHKTRFRERGFNQSKLLADVIAGITGIPVMNALERLKNNRPQSSMPDVDGKRANVKGIFAPVKNCEIKGKRLILIDDVYTTGSTVNECAKALIKSGTEEVLVLTAAISKS